jgi:2-polyprenyl-6-methoxyphenol hydroxylase-like FAD-dependent oxidoreductase
VDAQLAILDERFAGAKWESAALRAAAHAADDFYFDSFVQVHMDSWSSGRATLVGDAAYCASPLSGMGTALALVGAYVLAGELGAVGDLSPENLQRALGGYETTVRPYVTNAQNLPAGIDGYAPNSNANIVITAQVMKWMQRWPFRSYADRKWMSKAEDFVLPWYRG